MTTHPFPPPPRPDRPPPPSAGHLPPPPAPDRPPAQPAPSGCAMLWRIIAIITAIIFVVVGLAVIGVLILVSTGKLTIWSNK